MQPLRNFVRPTPADYRIDPCGFIRIEAAAFLQLACELQLRVLGKGIAAVGGSSMPVPLAKLEALVQTVGETLAGAAAQAAVGPAAAATWTLARASVSAVPGAIVLEREPGRRPGSEITLPAGASVLWDGRFWVAAGSELSAPIAVRAVGETGLSLLRRQVELPASVPLRSLRALPGFWKEAVLVAVPSVNFFWRWDCQPLRAFRRLCATCCNRRRRSAAPGLKRAGPRAGWATRHLPPWCGNLWPVGRAKLARAADREPKLGKVLRGSYVKVLGSGVMPAARNSWDRSGGLASQAIKDTR